MILVLELASADRAARVGVASRASGVHSNVRSWQRRPRLARPVATRAASVGLAAVAQTPTWRSRKRSRIATPSRGDAEAAAIRASSIDRVGASAWHPRSRLRTAEGANAAAARGRSVRDCLTIGLLRSQAVLNCRLNYLRTLLVYALSDDALGQHCYSVSMNNAVSCSDGYAAMPVERNACTKQP